MIRVEGVSKRFGDTSALSSVTFGIKRGEIFGIVGPDGAGKSTLLRLISGILDASEGSIFVNNINVAADPFAVKENLAYMPQRFGLYEDLSVEENLVFFGKLFGVTGKEIRSRLPGLYEFSRLEKFKDRLAGNLSGGMKQKLGLACCLVHKPDVILLDEPTNGVDPVSRREFWRILYALLSSGVTILVSTAYLDEAERCGRVALIHEGKFIRTGTPAEIKNGMNGVMLELLTDDPWAAENALKLSAKFGTIIREGKSLRMFTSEKNKAAKEISAVMKKAKISRFDITVKSPSLENCFVEIISGGAGL